MLNFRSSQTLLALSALGLILTCAAPNPARAEGVILRSDHFLPGYSATREGMFEKVTDVDPYVADRKRKWQLKTERRNCPGIGFKYDSRQRNYIKSVMVPYDATKDAPKYRSYVVWSKTKQPGYHYNRASRKFIKVIQLTDVQARDRGLR